MSHFQQPDSHGQGVMMSYQPQPKMKPSPSTMLLPSQPMMAPMAVQPSVMSMSSRSQPGSAVRCIAICDIVCSSFMIAGAFLGMLTPLVKMGSDFKKKYPEVFFKIYAGICAANFLSYLINAVFAFSVLTIARSAGSWKVTGWICSQVLAILIDGALLGYCFYNHYYWVAGSVVASIIHCVGIGIACRFSCKVQNDGGEMAVATATPGGGDSQTSVIVLVASSTGQWDGDVQEDPSKDDIPTNQQSI